MTRLAVLAPVALLAAACARFSLPLATVPTPRPASSSAGGGEARPALTIVLGGSLPRAAETRAAIERALGRSFALTFAAPPSAPPGTSTRVATVEQELAAVRRSYIDAEFQPCLEKLGEIQRVGELLAEGERTGKTVSIHVERHNPALGLYDRLGFRPVGEHGVYVLMRADGGGAS